MQTMTLDELRQMTEVQLRALSGPVAVADQGVVIALVMPAGLGAEERRQRPSDDRPGGVGGRLANERDRLRADAQEAAVEFDASGRHATQEAVDEWLARLEAGEELSPPPCGSRNDVLDGPGAGLGERDQPIPQRREELDR